MNGGHFAKVERGFQAALSARGDGGGGGGLDLFGLCDGDEAVAAEVRELLRHFEAAGADRSAAGGAGVTQSLFLDPGELHGARAEAGGRIGGRCWTSGGRRRSGSGWGSSR